MNNQLQLSAALMGISSGAQGTLETLKIMARVARIGKRHLDVRMAAMQAVSDVEQKAFIEEAKAVQQFIKNTIRYVKDIRGIETIQTPEITLAIGQGDCDDQSILVAAMLESIGHPARFVAISFDGIEYAHVFTETKIGSNWYSVETTEPVAFGWRPKGVRNRLIVGV